MSNTILVAYATHYGSTQEVAEAIAAEIRSSGHDVDLQPLSQVHDLTPYHAVVIGSPLYMGKMQQDAHHFLAAQRDALTRLPAAIFALGPLSTDLDEMRGSREQLNRELAQYPWLKPVSTEMFVGKYDPASLSFVHKLIAILPASPLHNLPASDHRDWDAIRTWAREIVPELA